MSEPLALKNLTRDRLVAASVTRPGGWRRALGLLVHPSLRPGEAVWLDPCGGIHTWGLTAAIDVLFLDAEHRVTGVARGVRPWQVRWKPPRTRSVVELRAGGATGVCTGDLLLFERVSSADAPGSSSHGRPASPPPPDG